VCQRQGDDTNRKWTENGHYSASRVRPANKREKTEIKSKGSRLKGERTEGSLTLKIEKRRQMTRKPRVGSQRGRRRGGKE